MVQCQGTQLVQAEALQLQLLVLLQGVQLVQQLVVLQVLEEFLLLFQGLQVVKGFLLFQEELLALLEHFQLQLLPWVFTKPWQSEVKGGEVKLRVWGGTKVSGQHHKR